MDVSLGALRDRLFSFRSWDSSGSTLNKRVRDALNTALDRLAGDVPEALVPDEEHVVLYADALGTDADIDARLNSTADPRVLKFSDSSSAATAISSSWTPSVDGTWDGVMHLEVKDPSDVWHRRQSREWWLDSGFYYVTIDRPWRNATDTLMEFRAHQPEFFVTDDVMEVLEPARIWDSTRQQVWSIDTAGAYRQDMLDFQGNSKARPYRMWRGRHFQMPTPRAAPTAILPEINQDAKDPTLVWVGPEQKGTFKFCYTIVWGRRDTEWQVAPGGIQDPVWESAPSPASAEVDNSNMKTSGTYDGIVLRAENIDYMTDFDRIVPSDAPGTMLRDQRSGFRIRFYAARESFELGASSGASGSGDNNIVESAGIYYLLAEIEPGNAAGVVTPTTTYVWTGAAIPDFYRPLKHSTGYYAWKVFPHQDQRYELDFRVLRLPRAFVDDRDTAPIQRDAVPALLELALHYMCLLDGVDQQGAQIHLDRFQTLARRYRARYATPGGIVEPVPFGGRYSRLQYGTFRSTT
jgi:hypothetical protein